MAAVAAEAQESTRPRSRPRFDLDRATPYLTALGIIVIQQVFFGVPLGIFVRGLLIGLLTALIALGMALTYRSNRFINFAQADMGTIPVVLIVMLMTAWGWPYLVAVPVGILAALAVGAIVELAVIRRFFKAPRLLITVASLGLSQLLTAIAILLPRLWGVDFPLLGQRLPAPFHLEFSIGTVVFDANDLIAMIVAPLALVGLALFLRLSSVGVAIRASADSADRASLLGVPVKRLQTLVWSVASLLAFTAIFLRAGILGLPVFGALTVGVLLHALAALVLGRMTNLLAIGANAVALGILEVSIGFAASSPLLIDPILALVIILALALSRRGSTRVDEAESSTWRSADDVRPIPDEVARIPVVQAREVGHVRRHRCGRLDPPADPLRRSHLQALDGRDLRGARPVGRGAHGLGRTGVARPDRVLRDRGDSRSEGDPRLAPRPQPRVRHQLRGGRSGRRARRAAGTQKARLLPRGRDACVLVGHDVVLPEQEVLRLGARRAHPSTAALRPHRHHVDGVVLLRRLRRARGLAVHREGHPRQPHRTRVHGPP